MTEATEKIGKFQFLLFRERMISPKEWMLVFGASVLRGDLSTSDYGIQNGSTIYIVKKPRCGPVSCISCPWGQLDLCRIGICGPCREKRLKILKHGHGEWNAIAHQDSDNNTKTAKDCMVCTNLAFARCDGCPLQLCDTCFVILERQCEFHNLFLYNE